MKAYIQRMIEEHAQLRVRIGKLHEYVYSSKSDKDDKVEFTNKCIQLAAMKKYEEALHARLENAGIVCDGNDYFERVATIEEKEPAGSDFDLDKERIEK